VTKNVCRVSMLAILVATLGGCSAGNLLGGKSSVPQVTTVPTGNQLALPPDLALQAPTQTVDAYQPNGPVASIAPNRNVTAPVQTASSSEELYSSGPVAKRSGGTFDETLAYYNISKTNADGTPKTSIDINRELTAAIKAEKRKTDPNYGTIFNIGNIFSDG
jgi:hypothetical protein